MAALLPDISARTLPLKLTLPGPYKTLTTLQVLGTAHAGRQKASRQSTFVGNGSLASISCTAQQAQAESWLLRFETRGSRHAFTLLPACDRVDALSAHTTRHTYPVFPHISYTVFYRQVAQPRTLRHAAR